MISNIGEEMEIYMKILLVDPDEIIRNRIKEMIRDADHGWKVAAEAEDAKSALHMLETCPSINLLIPDISKLGMSGTDFIKRVREYYADNFAGSVTGNPNYLTSALVKIGYGLKENKNESRVDSISALGISDDKAAKVLSMSADRGKGTFDIQKLKNIAKWDLYNPWATIYEINSTHPLIAKRLKKLSEQSVEMGKTPIIAFNITIPRIITESTNSPSPPITESKKDIPRKNSVNFSVSPTRRFPNGSLGSPCPT